jgi:hypothetical protein
MLHALEADTHTVWLRSPSSVQHFDLAAGEPSLGEGEEAEEFEGSWCSPEEDACCRASAAVAPKAETVAPAFPFVAPKKVFGPRIVNSVEFVGDFSGGNVHCGGQMAIAGAFCVVDGAAADAGAGPCPGDAYAVALATSVGSHAVVKASWADTDYDAEDLLWRGNSFAEVAGLTDRHLDCSSPTDHGQLDCFSQTDQGALDCFSQTDLVLAVDDFGNMDEKPPAAMRAGTCFLDAAKAYDNRLPAVLNDDRAVGDNVDTAIKKQRRRCKNKAAAIASCVPAVDVLDKPVIVRVLEKSKTKALVDILAEAHDIHVVIILRSPKRARALRALLQDGKEVSPLLIKANGRFITTADDTGLQSFAKDMIIYYDDDDQHGAPRVLYSGVQEFARAVICFTAIDTSHPSIRGHIP